MGVVITLTDVLPELTTVVVPVVWDWATEVCGLGCCGVVSRFGDPCGSAMAIGTHMAAVSPASNKADCNFPSRLPNDVHFPRRLPMLFTAFPKSHGSQRTPTSPVEHTVATYAIAHIASGCQMNSS